MGRTGWPYNLLLPNQKRMLFSPQDAASMQKQQSTRDRETPWIARRPGVRSNGVAPMRTRPSLFAGD